MRRILFLLILFFIVVGYAQKTEYSEAEKDFIEFTKKQAIPLEDGFVNKGLEAFKKSIGNAQFVALSESGHHIKEQLAMNVRLAQFLVKEMGFTVVTLESSFPDSKIINDYILGKDIKNKIWQNHLNHIYKWDEFTSLIEWLKVYNESITDNSKKVQIYGLDIPGFYKDLTPVLTTVLGYLHKVGPTYATQVKTEIMPILESIKTEKNRQQPYYFNKLATAKKHDLIKNIHMLLEHLIENEALYIEKSEKKTYQWIKQVAIGMYQAINYYEQNNNFKNSEYTNYVGANLRDLHMFQNLKWIHNKNPEAKMVIINHNLHTKRKAVYSSGSFGYHTSFGSFMSNNFKDKYYSIGCLSYIKRKKSIPKLEKMYGINRITVGNLLTDAELNHPIFFIDMHSIPKQSLAYNWYKHTTYTIGKWDMIPLNYPNDFDGYIFYKNNTNLFKGW